MKKILPADQPEINKETIANLTAEQLREIEGGAAATANDCNTSCWGSYSCHAGVTEQAASAE